MASPTPPTNKCSYKEYIVWCVAHLDGDFESNIKLMELRAKIDTTIANASQRCDTTIRNNQTRAQLEPLMEEFFSLKSNIPTAICRNSYCNLVDHYSAYTTTKQIEDAITKAEQSYNYWVDYTNDKLHLDVVKYNAQLKSLISQLATIETEYNKHDNLLKDSDYLALLLTADDIDMIKASIIETRIRISDKKKDIEDDTEKRKSAMLGFTNQITQLKLLHQVMLRTKNIADTRERIADANATMMAEVKDEFKAAIDSNNTAVSAMIESNTKLAELASDVDKLVVAMEYGKKTVNDACLDDSHICEIKAEYGYICSLINKTAMKTVCEYNDAVSAYKTAYITKTDEAQCNAVTKTEKYLVMYAKIYSDLCKSAIERKAMVAKNVAKIYMDKVFKTSHRQGLLKRKAELEAALAALLE